MTQAHAESLACASSWETDTFPYWESPRVKREMAAEEEKDEKKQKVVKKEDVKEETCMCAVLESCLREYLTYIVFV